MYRVFAVNENKAICQWLEKTIGEEKYLDIISNAADDPDYNPLSTNYVSEMSECSGKSAIPMIKKIRIIIFVL